MNLKRPAPPVSASTPIILSPPQKVINNEGNTQTRNPKTEPSESPPSKKMREIKLKTSTIQKMPVPTGSKTSPGKGPTTSAKYTKSKQKILNKDLNKMIKAETPLILNKNASQARTALLTEAIIKTTVDGNVEIITDIQGVQNNETKEDPYKVAPTVETNVFPCDKCERSFPLKQLLAFTTKITFDSVTLTVICVIKHFSASTIWASICLFTPVKSHSNVWCA